jgi:hypothetical protein
LARARCLTIPAATRTRPSAISHSRRTGNANTAIGAEALGLNTTGPGNTAIGVAAVFTNTTGDENIGVGFNALFLNATGSSNTAIGTNALSFSIGSGNTALGFDAGSAVTTANNVIAIGSVAANVSNSCYIGNIFGATSTGGSAVFINASGQLGTLTSSKRFKEEIKAMDKASEALLALKPVTFRYKKEIDPARTSQFGLVAEEVEKVNRDLVVRDKDGKPYSVRYDAVNAMLLNEFLKQHRKVEEQDHRLQEQEVTIAQLKAAAAKQEAVNAEQQKGMEIVIARLKEQDAKIQKVNDKVELSKPAPRTVDNHQ